MCWVGRLVLTLPCLACRLISLWPSCTLFSVSGDGDVDGGAAEVGRGAGKVSKGRGNAEPKERTDGDPASVPTRGAFYLHDNRTECVRFPHPVLPLCVCKPVCRSGELVSPCTVWVLPSLPRSLPSLLFNSFHWNTQGQGRSPWWPGRSWWSRRCVHATGRLQHRACERRNG